jgi:hypothetical protein
MLAHKKFPTVGASLLAIAAATLGWATEAEARVASVIIDSPAAAAFGGAAIGAAGPYVTLKGRVFGELDPHDQHNVMIQDLELAPKDAHGKVQYIATFQITMPADLSKASGLMFNEVSNRGGNAIPGTAAAVVPGAIYLESGWQGDLLAHCATDYPCTPLDVPFTGTQQVIQVPVAKNRDGSTITGPVYGHIANASGNTAQMVIFTTPVPYQPLSMDTKKTALWSLASQTITGVDGPKTLIASADWAWATAGRCPSPALPIRRASACATVSTPTCCTRWCSRRRIRWCSASVMPRHAMSSRSFIMRAPTTTAPPIRSPMQSAK